jgi:20S proteasome alpha/beta subunit
MLVALRPHPQPKRLLRRKSLTIALGILSGDYIVVAADTMESTGYAGNIQTETEKISSGSYVAADGAGGICMTGAGDSGYLDAIKQEIIETFVKDHIPINEFETYFKKHLMEFYSNHVIPFGQFPASDRPSFDLIVGAEQNGHAVLLATDRNSVRHRTFPKPYAAVGAGSLYASLLLSRLFVNGMEKNLARVLAAYIVYATKRNVEGCGKNTHIATIVNNRPVFTSPREISRLEELFDEYETIESRAFWYSMGYTSEQATPAKDLETIAGWLQDLRDKILQVHDRM